MIPLRATVPVEEAPDVAARLTAFTQRQEAAQAAGKAGRAALLAALEAEYAASPDPLLLAWLGSARSLQAIDAPLSRKLDWMRRGAADLDAAVAAAPEDAAVRLTRAQHGVAIPKIFGRHRISRTDFDWLANAALAPEPTLPPTLLPLVQAAAGAYWLEQGDPRCLPLLRAAVAALSPPPPELARLLQQAENDHAPPDPHP